MKFFELEARFPGRHYDFPPAVEEFVAKQVRVPAPEFGKYLFTGRTFENHVAQIRTQFGFREATRADEDRLTMWLAEQVCPSELVEARQREALLARCRLDRIEPPGRVDRIINSAVTTADERFVAVTVQRLAAVPGGV